MTLDIVDLESTLQKFGDQSAEYTAEEEEALNEIFEMLDHDEDMQPWMKYAHRSLIIVGLRACNLDAKLAFKTLKVLHIHATQTYPELFAQIDPLNLEPIIRKRLFQVVKRPVDEGPAVVVFRIKNWKPSEASIEQLALTGALYVYTVAKLSPEIQRQGIIVVGDISGFKMSHARSASLDLLMKAIRLYTTIPPMIKGVVAINSLALFEHTFNIFKWVLPEELRKLIHITKSDMSHISKLMEPERLPEEFWGTMPDEDAYEENIEEKILADPQLFLLIKHLQEEILARSNYRRK